LKLPILAICLNGKYFRAASNLARISSTGIVKCEGASANSFSPFDRKPESPN
jgi:hypothetical protein